jgi:hypothetical protein
VPTLAWLTPINLILHQPKQALHIMARHKADTLLQEVSRQLPFPAQSGWGLSRLHPHSS